MVERTVTIRNRAGLHTRPAAAIVKIAAKFKSEFWI
jgi:phosphocarrier protein